LIDVGFDSRTDSNGRDADKFSSTLKRYQKELWTKKTMSGQSLELVDDPGSYLLLLAKDTSLRISSDSISNSLRSHKRLAAVINSISSGQLDDFQRAGSTIGAKIIFPGDKVDGKLTINVERGFNSKIRDRFDLTLECIRRHYLGLESPLSAVLERHADFFEMFSDFEGYVDFFLLQDLVAEGSVRFFLPFDDEFQSQVLPKTADQYLQYKSATMEFVQARNSRISAWSSPS
jgi:hypothetical protein